MIRLLVFQVSIGCLGMKISIITATYNAAPVLPRLIESLRAQADRDFEWIVVDGASTDDTLAILAAAGDVVTTFISEHDFGIYDALNKGLKTASGDYYLVLGADDSLYPDAIKQYRAALLAGPVFPDIVTASISSGGSVCSARVGRAWLYGLRGYVSSHSIGALIKRSLHDSHGYYSRKFPIAADQYFIKKAGDSGAVIKVCDFCAGVYGTEGVSSVDVAGTLTEIFRIQLATEKNKFFQLMIFVGRLLKNYRRL